MTDAEPSPVWVPDSEAPTCMHCLKSEFTVINRRVTNTHVLLNVAFYVNVLITYILWVKKNYKISPANTAYMYEWNVVPLNI